MTPTSDPAPVQPQQRLAYPVFRSISSRWSDNDVYGHVNNAVYYSWFDTAVNAHLIEQGALDVHGGDTIGLVVETRCLSLGAATVTMGQRIWRGEQLLIEATVRAGFLTPEGNAYGRPVGVALDGKGALLVADDVGNAIWRVGRAK